MSGIPISWSRGHRLVLLIAATAAALKCGKGDDVTGPPGSPGSPSVASVEVAPNPVDLSIGQEVQLIATVKAADGTVLSDRAIVWATSDPAIAGIEENGMLTGVAEGTATVTATSEGHSGLAAITVTAAQVASVEVIPHPSSVLLAQSAQLTAIVRGASGEELSGRPVTWSSSDEAIATITETGLVTGVAVGASTITATSEGQVGSSDLTVSSVPVSTVEVSPANPSINVGGTVLLSATAKDAGGAVLAGRPAVWTTSDANVARVNPIGRVTGIAAGTATIVATIEGRTGSATVSVTQQPVANVEVTPNPANVAVQQTIQLTATLRAGDGSELTGRQITWESSNQGVATVSPTGLVRGLAVGTATITARSEGRSGTTALTVTQTQQPVATIELTPNMLIQVAVQGTFQFSAILKAADGTVLTGRSITWTSSNDAVARISASGLATGLAPGSVIITASSEGKSDTGELIVVPAAGIERTWRGGTNPRPQDWSIPGNWVPAGKPFAQDAVRVPVRPHPAVLSEDVEVARLIISGGSLRLAGHRLRISGQQQVPTTAFVTK